MTRNLLQKLLFLVVFLGLSNSAGAFAFRFNFEVRQPSGENIFARWVYGACGECTLEQFEAIVPPPGFLVAPPKSTLFDSGTADLPQAPPGVLPALDLVPEIPGEEFRLIAKVEDAQILGVDPEAGVFANASVRRSTLFQFNPERVVHEVMDPDGNAYVLIFFDTTLLDVLDPLELDAFSAIAIPDGWTYSSRVLDGPMLVNSNGLATVFSQGVLGTWQRLNPDITAISGKRLAIRNRKADDPGKTRIVFKSQDAAIAVPGAGSAGDPRCGAGNGGNLAFAGTTSETKFLQTLPCERWSAIGPDTAPRGYRYKDGKREQGPCSRVVVQDGKLTASCAGRPHAPLDYDLEVGQRQGPLVAMLALGDTTYCTRFGGDVRKDGSNGKLYSAKDAPAPSTCPSSCVPDEGDVPISETPDGIRFVVTPEERFANLDGYPFAPHYVSLDGLRIHYVDEGPIDGEVILLMHGQPSWSYLYRKMIPLLAGAGYRVIAPDNMGMGRSDKPVELSVHRYEQHIEWHKRFIAELGLQDITLFAQDWGGLIGLRIVGDLPHLFARAVASNTTLPVIPPGLNPYTFPDSTQIDCALGDFEIPANFQAWIEYALTAPNLRPHQVVETLTVNSLTPEQASAYDAPYPSLIYRAAIRAFPSMITAVESENLPAWQALGDFEKPFLTLAGELDANLGSPAQVNRLINHIPGAAGQNHERFPAHHFIQEDIGETLADRVITFMLENPLPAP